MVLEKEWDYFNENSKRLAKWYPNSFVVIKEHTVYGGFPSILEAYLSALQKFEAGTFLVLKTLPQARINQGNKVAVELGVSFWLWDSLRFIFTFKI